MGISHELNPVFNEEESRRIEEEFRIRKDVIYLDHAGSSLYSVSSVRSAAEDLCTNVYSNPHSRTVTSKATSDIIEQVRYRILKHVNAPLDEYHVIFLSGATAALKLVAESFSFSDAATDASGDWHPAPRKNGDNGVLAYLEESHTSVLGMREVVEVRGVQTKCIVQQEAFTLFNRHLEPSTLPLSSSNSLLVYPGQCNFSGFKYPLSWIDSASQGALRSLCDSKWYVMLDAASLLATSTLDLTHGPKPHFVCLSTYKLFGAPTGLGALLVHSSAAHLLTKHYYGGGTVNIALPNSNSFIPRTLLHERFEDGTLDFLSIISLHHSFEVFHGLVRSMERVSKHCHYLARYLYESLKRLHHANGSPVVKVYHDTEYDDISTQGPIVNFNLLRPTGEFIGFVEVLEVANAHGIQMRTGCFCNPGACRRHLNLSKELLLHHLKSGHVCGDDKDLVEGVPTGSVRASLGCYSTKADVDKLLQVVEKCFVQQPALYHWPGSDENPLVIHMLGPAQDVNSTPAPRLQELAPCNLPDFSLLSQEKKSTDNLAKRVGLLNRIFLYPVKSCGRLEVTSWQLDHRGLRYDREWMVVGPTGAALTQKKAPKLATIRPRLDQDARLLILTAPGAEDCTVSLEEGGAQTGGSLCGSKVCGDRVKGTDCGEAPAAWLSSLLGLQGLRLVRQASSDSRLAGSKRYNQSPGPALSLANQAQYLLLNIDSVTWLSDQIESSEFNKDGMVDRFRSNFVVSDFHEAFIEQSWSGVTIGDVAFNVSGECTRCQMICIDQDTGAASGEPLTTLAAALKGKLRFGMYLMRKSNSPVTISVGDPVVPQ